MKRFMKYLTGTITILIVIMMGWTPSAFAGWWSSSLDDDEVTVGDVLKTCDQVEKISQKLSTQKEVQDENSYMGVRKFDLLGMSIRWNRDHGNHDVEKTLTRVANNLNITTTNGHRLVGEVSGIIDQDRELSGFLKKGFKSDSNVTVKNYRDCKYVVDNLDDIEDAADNQMQADIKKAADRAQDEKDAKAKAKAKIKAEAEAEKQAKIDDMKQEHAKIQRALRNMPMLQKFLKSETGLMSYLGDNNHMKCYDFQTNGNAYSASNIDFTHVNGMRKDVLEGRINQVLDMVMESGTWSEGLTGECKKYAQPYIDNHPELTK